MKQPPPDPLTPATRSTTVLNRVAPTVVRRRVVEVPVASRTSPLGYSADDDDDENGPPSSVNVARALASLRGHELERLEGILSEQDEEEAELAAATAQRERERPPPSLPRVPTVRVGPTITVSVLAQRLGVDDQDLVTSLVTHGFFSVTVKSTLPRETARAAATLYGYQIEETDEVVTATPKSNASKSKPQPKPTKAKPSKKPAAAAVTRRTSRRA
jgi:CBS domain-containing protein